MTITHASATDEYVFDRVKQFTFERIVQHGCFVVGEDYFLESHPNVLGRRELQNIGRQQVQIVVSFQQIDVNLPNGYDNC